MEREAVLKILFILPCTKFFSSAQKRVIDYTTYIQSAGFKPILFSYTSPVLYGCWINTRLDAGNLALRFLQHLFRLCCGFLALASRGWALIKLMIIARRFDGFFFQWITPPAWCTFVLKRINPRIAFDFDDAVFLRKPAATRALVRSSMIVSAGSHYNYDYAEKLNKNTVFLPTPVPIDRFSAREHSSNLKQVIIGWIGTISTLPSMDILLGVLDRLAEGHPAIVLRIIGSGNRDDLIPEFSRIRCEVIPNIPYEEVPAAVEQFDIGLMPMKGEEWDKGKCVGKALEYMAAGVPAVVSNFGENPYAITDGVNGFLASTDEEWYQKLSLLIESSELRRRIGLAGRRTAEERYSTQVCARILIDQVLSKLTDSSQIRK